MVPSSAEEEEKNMKNPAFPEGVPETPPVHHAGEEAALPHEHPDPAVRAAMRASIEQANRVDGMRTDGASSGPIYRRQQRSGLHDHLAPYYEEKQWFLADEEEVAQEIEEERIHRIRALQRPSREKDFWTVDLSAGQVLRHHLRKRKTMFDPRLNRDIPVPLNMLKEVRKTTTGRSPTTRTVEDDWMVATPRAEETWWKGVTTFYIKDIQEVTTYLAEKKGQDEVNLKTESAQDLEEWKQADLSEWNKVTQSGAKVLGLEESQRIRRELQEQGKGDRILPTKIARRYKPGEQPGEPATKKSTLCIRGDLDPDILELERFAPTLNTVNFNLMLQVAANENMTATVGDLKNAFCQSQPLCRPNGPLYFQQPKEGVIGLHPDQIVQIVAGCYGLVDAPLHWRKSLTEDLKALGYEMSALDPCIMKLYDKSRRRLLGAIAIEVDDLFTVGHQEHHEKTKQLRTKYTFGKYVALREEKDGCAFNGRRIRQLPDGGYLVDMQKFIEERLHPVDLEKGRKSQKKEPATPEEVSMARATCGALNWLSREGRPDASGPSSLISKLSKLTVEDLVQLNQVVDNLKEHAAMSLKIQPLKKMRMSVVTDASFANNGFHSQGGHLVLAHERELRDGLPARANIIAWRSGKLQRVVNSTLAAETQSLSRGLAELMWVMVLAQELQDGTFNVKKWRDRLENEELMVMSSERSENTLKEALAVVDAKSLYDHLSKDTLGGQDRRTAIEIQIVRQDLKQVQGCVKWVHHLAMPADGLTKVSGSNKALYELIQSGMYSIRPAEEEMENRAKAREEGQTNSQLRRIGIKEKGRNCETRRSRTRASLIPIMTWPCGPMHRGRS